jgi:AcrR family transcriptional regulator
MSTPVTTTTPVDPPASTRADARRNRARVLAAAEEIFADGGLAAPVEAIARRAGVGAGTIYRHFPTKEALFEAVVGQRIAAFSALGRRLADQVDAGTTGAGAAFEDYFRQVVAGAAVNHALCDAIETGSGRRPKLSPRMAEEHQAGLAGLLTRAQAAGAIRADVDADDVAALMTGSLHAESRRGQPGRMANLAMDALRAAPATAPTTASLAASVTKPAVTKPVPDHRCVVCGTPLRTATTGRPARYCGAACRQRAHRRKSIQAEHSG